jgi:predicted RNase H-like nuclease (RuvC/YqgF family)
VKHREFWIHGEDYQEIPVTDWFTRVVVSDRNMWDSGQNIHVIEYAAYEELEAEVSILKDRLAELEGYYEEEREENERLEAENARLKEALEDQGKLVRRLSEMFKEDGV